MKYEEIYNEYYNRYYNLFECKIKRYLVKTSIEDRHFIFVVREFNNYKNKVNDRFKKNDFENFEQIFSQKDYYYTKNSIQKTLENEVKNAYDNSKWFNKKYSFFALIRRIAFLEVRKIIIGKFPDDTKQLEIIYNLHKIEHFENILNIEPIPKLEDIENNDITDNNADIDLSFQLSILEIIMKLDRWEDLSATKKGEVLSYLLGKNKDNIKKYYIELGKKPSDPKSKFFDKSGKYSTDKKKAENIVKLILG